MKYFIIYLLIGLICLFEYVLGYEGLLVDDNDYPVLRTKIKLIGGVEHTTFTENGRFKFDALDLDSEYTLQIIANNGNVVHEQSIVPRRDSYFKLRIGLPSLESKWEEDVYIKRMNFLLGKDSLYKYLDKSTLSIIEPELKTIYNDAHKKIIEYFQTKVQTTKSVQVGTYFDEDKYLTHLLALSNPSQAESDNLKRVYTYPRYDDIKQSKNREIKINRVSYKKTPKWSDVVKYAGGYSKLAEKGISKEKIGNFTLTEKLDFIEIINNEICKAHFRMYGEKEAFDFYNQIEKSRTLMGDIIIPKIDYSNLDKVEIRYDLGKGELNGRLTIMSKRDQKEMKSTIKTMFDDLVSKDEFDNVLFNNPKTKKYSKKWIIAQNKKKAKERAKIESDIAESKFSIDSKLVSLGYFVDFINNLSIEQKKLLLKELENGNEKYYEYVKITALGLGFVYVKDLIMIESGVFFSEIIDSNPKGNFGDKFYYQFENIVKIEVPKRKMKKFRKRAKWKKIYPKN